MSHPGATTPGLPSATVSPGAPTGAELLARDALKSAVGADDMGNDSEDVVEEQPDDEDDDEDGVDLWQRKYLF